MSTSTVIGTIEADVQAVITKIITGVDTVIADVDAAFQWVLGEIGPVVSGLEQVVSWIEDLAPVTTALGLTPEATAAIAAANEAVAGSTAFASAANSGSNPAVAVVAGY